MINFEQNPALLQQAHRLVIKVGSSLVTNDGKGLDEEAIGHWCAQLAVLVQQGKEVIMVSSGAVAEGMKRLGWTTRPKEINELQAAAAVGQMGLVQMYETKLRQHQVGSAQVLLTHADLADRERYLNARPTLPITRNQRLQLIRLQLVERHLHPVAKAQLLAQIRQTRKLPDQGFDMRAFDM
jgi:glutamate 5-kinase